MKRLVVVALGGNALGRGWDVSWPAQVASVRRPAAAIARLYEKGFGVVVTHGNGPQAGVQMLRHEALGRRMAPYPLDAIVAETQGSLGYLLSQAIDQALGRRGIPPKAVALVSRVLVDPRDPLLKRRDKPVGPYYEEGEVEELRRRHRDWVLAYEVGRGYRRRVPSPRPRGIVELGAVRELLEAGHIPIVAGGGGIPVRAIGLKAGVEGVVDKDLAAALLAIQLKADTLVLATDVDAVYLNYRREGMKRLGRVPVSLLERYHGEGHFPPGSMGPKVEAAISFVKQGGVAVIGLVTQILKLALLRGGTVVHP